MRLLILILLAGFFSSCRKNRGAEHPATSPPESSAFWVWHRSSPLTPAEVRELHHARIHTLHWQAAEATWSSGKWQPVRISRPIPPVPRIEIVPVFRLQPDPAFLGHPSSPSTLARMITLWSEGTPLRAIQLDFDCPDRLLPDYTRFLRKLSAALPETSVSITALASWPRHPAFPALAKSVHGIAPMFYDLHPDSPEQVARLHFHPIADHADLPLIDLWKRCPVPWHAGLPNFERVSVFRPDGTLSGHLRGWDHGTLFFHPQLTPEPLGKGITLYRVPSAIHLFGTPIPAGSIIVHRTADPTALAAMKSAAGRSGAASLLYFALPGPGIRAAFSPAHLNGQDPRLSLTLNPDQSVTLTNTGASLPARPCDPADPSSPGWTLTLTSPAPSAFVSASPGDFLRLRTPASHPPELSRQIHLHFPALPSGKSLTTPPLIANPRQLTWEVPDIAPGQPLE